MPRARKHMSVERAGSGCLKVSLILYTLLFWASGFGLIFLGFYVIFEPKRSYVLDFVDFSEDDPLLTFAAYTAIVAGISTLLVGFIGFFGALNRMKCLLVGFMICLIALFLADVAIGTLALVYKGKFSDDRMTVYLTNLTNNRYSRDKWVKPLLDTVQFYIDKPNSTFHESLRRAVKFEYGVSLEIERNRKVTNMINRLQFYEQCCGAMSADDYLGSSWMASMTGDPAYEDVDPPLVPESCCKQIAGASPLNPVARSQARCQQPESDNKWRYTTGCNEKMLKWFDEQTIIFASVGFSFAGLMMIGIILTLCLCNSIVYYVHIDQDY